MAEVLAVIPARSGSKGVPDKNLTEVGGESLLARAARCVVTAGFGGRALVSTDSPFYAEEAARAGVDAPFLRPAELSGDDVPAIAVLEHAVAHHEAGGGRRVDAVLWVEPTSPLRRPDDLRAGVELFTSSGADSVVAVSPVPTQFHPDKLLVEEDGLVRHHTEQGAGVVARQQLRGTYYVRNGVCYVVGRTAIDRGAGFVSDRTAPLVIDRPVANIDTPLDLAWAAFLLEREEPW